MTLTKFTLQKIRWLFSMPAFRRAPVAVAGRVLKWEVLRLLHRPIRYTYDGDFPVTLRPNEGASRLAYYFGVTEPYLFAFYDCFLRPGMVVVDAGANIGLHALFFAKRIAPGGSVYSFEPAPKIFERLVTHVRDSGQRNIRCLNSALGAVPGFVELVHDVQDTSRTSVRLESGGEKSSRDRVPVESLDDFTAKESISRIDFLKIDVEGFEGEILRGASSLLREGKIEVLQVEIDPTSLDRAGSNPCSILGVLEACGYRLASWEATTRSFRPATEVAYNSFFVRAGLLTRSAPATEWHVGSDHQS
jgi:FkbM family methyltransferase